MSQQNSLSNIEEIKARFDEEQIKRIKKELYFLSVACKDKILEMPKVLLEFPHNKKAGIHLKLNYNPEMFPDFYVNENDLKNEEKSLKLEIQIDSNFSRKSSPRVFIIDLNHPMAKGLCNDGRDFLEDIIKQSWNPLIFLVEIITAIPNFLKDIMKVLCKPSPLEDLITLGRFKSDKDYEVSWLKNNGNLVFFEQGFELIINKSDNSSNYGLKEKGYALSPYFLLSFENAGFDEKTDTLKLANVRSLVYLISVTVKRYIDDSLSNTMVLKWKNGHLQIISFDNSDVFKFLDALGNVANVPLIKILKKTKYTRPISIKEVSSSAYKGVDRHNLEASIEVLEQSILHEKIDVENEEHVEKIRDLIELYRKAVEFHSAQGNEEFHVYLKKMNGLLIKEEVQKALKK